MLWHISSETRPIFLQKQGKHYIIPQVDWLGEFFFQAQGENVGYQEQPNLQSEYVSEAVQQSGSSAQ